MPDSKTSALVSAGALTGSELIQVVQSGSSKKSLISAILTYIKLGITKTDVGLANVDNTSDANKPVSTAQATAIGLKLNSAEKGAANGVATLGADSKIPSAQLPAIAISDTFVVSSQVAQTSLTAETGDVAVRTDLNKSYILKVNDPTVFSNWQELLTPTDAVISVNGFTGAVSLTTTNVAEGTNLYYTQARFDSALAAKSTSNLAEGSNLYYTQARFDSALSAKSTSNLAEGSNLYYTQARFDTAFAAKFTTGLAEGTNLYYTQARFDTAFTAKSTTNLSEGTNLYYTAARVTAQIPVSIHAATNKAVPVDADEVAGTDSASSFSLVHFTWTNIKAFLKTYFDTLYRAKANVFISADQTITAAGTLTLPHGLSAAPNSFRVLLVNQTAELGFTVGQITPYGYSGGGAANQGVGMTSDATNVLITYGSQAAVFNITRKDTGASANITIANWKARFVAIVEP